MLVGEPAGVGYEQIMLDHVIDGGQRLRCPELDGVSIEVRALLGRHGLEPL
jgi:hypothetical protein